MKKERGWVSLVSGFMGGVLYLTTYVALLTLIFVSVDNPYNLPSFVACVGAILGAWTTLAFTWAVYDILFGGDSDE